MSRFRFCLILFLALVFCSCSQPAPENPQPYVIIKNGTAYNMVLRINGDPVSGIAVPVQIGDQVDLDVYLELGEVEIFKDDYRFKVMKVSSTANTTLMVEHKKTTITVNYDGSAISFCLDYWE